MKQIINFLSELQANNNREWFAANKDKFQAAQKKFHDMTARLILCIHDIDPSVGMPEPESCVFRMYRDVRFSKIKLPYKTNFGAFIARGGRKSPWAGYYVHVEPGGSFVSGGLYVPSPEILRGVRTRIVKNEAEFLSIVEKKIFKKNFAFFTDDMLKRIPAGFDPESPAAEYCKFKHFAPFHPLNDADLAEKNFISRVTRFFALMKPLNDFLNAAVEQAAVTSIRQ